MPASTRPRKRPPTKRPAKGKRKGKAKAPKTLIRTSEFTTFKRCRWQWDRNYNDRLQPREQQPALRFGSLVHAALELRYPPGTKRGPKPAVTFEKLYEQELREAEKTWGFRDADGEWADAGQLGVAMLENYVKEYGKDEEWKVLASEMTFQVPVYSPEHPDGNGYMNLRGERIPRKVVLFYYVGTMDGVWQNRMDGGVRINDYKTTKGDPEKEAQGKYQQDEQASAYWTYGVDWLEAKGILKPKELQALDGMLYTFLRKAKPDERPKNAQGQSLNQDGSVSKKQPGLYFFRDLVYRSREQTTRMRERSLQVALEMQAVRDGKLAAYKSPGTGFPDQQCKACSYADICELDEMGEDWHLLARSTMTKWDPYDAHVIQEEGKF